MSEDGRSKHHIDRRANTIGVNSFSRPANKQHTWSCRCWREDEYGPRLRPHSLFTYLSVSPALHACRRSQNSPGTQKGNNSEGPHQAHSPWPMLAKSSVQGSLRWGNFQGGVGLWWLALAGDAVHPCFSERDQARAHASQPRRR
ncbi:hypothetical protein FOQG_19655 [Fusarium oxysporum f. sp. raphani 54005]|uniref:Uncharacterized protein n=1 Tax=Fusarium oxysporum f. sp. raphani 54005 TaxID=1089458 RepID=X0BAQ0_FUSOX|nr:hypothetical protein FOQG_19655 [Fusarium oxysporum f. sp. raphani 54005]